MSTKKVYDLTVKTGEWTNHEGQTKGRYLNVGSIMLKDDGGKFIMLNRTFNPAGVPNTGDRDSIILSMFKVEEKEQQQQQAPQQQDKPAYTPPASTDNEDIPF